MSDSTWLLTTPIDAVVFDCDGTLSFIEGIDELAERNGVGEPVALLTEKAMSETGITPDLYEKRMSMVKPSRGQLIQLGLHYFLNRTPDSLEVIEVLKALNKTIYVLSAGLNPAVKIFAALLGVSEDNVYAVDTRFENQGDYQGYNDSSPLTKKDGKRTIMQQLRPKHSQILLAGDGMNDREALDFIDRFVGYGGAFYREKVAALCDFYIRCCSLTPLLPLILTESERDQLLPAARLLYDRGLKWIEEGGVNFQPAISNQQQFQVKSQQPKTKSTDITE